MSMPPKSPPRFVPTLTDVVHGHDAVSLHRGASERLPRAPVTPSSPSVPMAAPQPQVPAALPHAAALPVGLEEHLVHRVMQRVDVVLDQRLREAIATVVQEQTRSMLPRLREEVESVVRQSVYEAVAQELAEEVRRT